MFPASATNNMIQVKRSLSKPQPPGWSRGRMDGEGLLGVQLRRTECEHMFSALPLKLGHCSTQSACLKGARLGSRATQSRLPLFPQQQTFLTTAVTSEMCQQH